VNSIIPGEERPSEGRHETLRLEVLGRYRYLADVVAMDEVVTNQITFSQSSFVFVKKSLTGLKICADRHDDCEANLLSRLERTLHSPGKEMHPTYTGFRPGNQIVYSKTNHTSLQAA
jgi:hypothetical protein